MVRKTIIFFASLIVCVAFGDAAFAVPSVRHLGANVSTSTEKPVATLPSLPKSAPEVVRSVKTQTVEKETADTARIPVLNSIKTISSSRIKQPVISASSAGQHASSGVSDSAFNSLVDRVQTLENESQKSITGVTEEETGNYVTGVYVDSDHKLNVNKTRVLYAPVFQGNTDTGANAEIWLVK